MTNKVELPPLNYVLVRSPEAERMIGETTRPYLPSVCVAFEVPFYNSASDEVSFPKHDGGIRLEGV